MASKATSSPRAQGPWPGFWCRLVRWLVVAGLGLLVGCGDGQATGGVAVLAKTGIGLEEADGALGDPMQPGLRVAVDRATADTLWDALEADNLEAVSDPAERGRHGQLGDVDFDGQAVVLWRGGESGSCPERLDGIATQDDGVVEVTLSRSLLAVACTDDYRPYAVLAAADRQALPEALPARGRAVGPGDQHTTFPVVDAGAPDAAADAPAVAMAALPPPQRRGAPALVAHPAWTVRDQGVLARPGDRFELAGGLSAAELVRTDDHGTPVGGPRALTGGAGRLPDAEEVTYRLTGQLDGQPAREWIRVPDIRRDASLRISSEDTEDVGDAPVGQALQVRVVNQGTVALGYRRQVEWHPAGPDTDPPGGDDPPSAPPQEDADDRVLVAEPGQRGDPIPTRAPDQPGVYKPVVRAGDGLLADGDGDTLPVAFPHRFRIH